MQCCSKVLENQGIVRPGALLFDRLGCGPRVDLGPIATDAGRDLAGNVATLLM